MKPTTNTVTGKIDFVRPNIVFNNTNCFMRNMSKSISELQEATTGKWNRSEVSANNNLMATTTKNIPSKWMVIGTNSWTDLNIKPYHPTPHVLHDEFYTNDELKQAATNSSYTMSGYQRKQDQYQNGYIFLMLQSGWNDNKIYDSQKNLMCSVLLNWTRPVASPPTSDVSFTGNNHTSGSYNDSNALSIIGANTSGNKSAAEAIIPHQT